MWTAERRRLLIIVFGRLVQFILSLVVLRVATTLLLPEEMGRMALVLAATAFFSLFLVNPVGMFINRRLNTWQDYGLARHYLNVYWYYLMIVAGVAALAVLALEWLHMIDFHMSSGWMIVLISGAILFSTVNQTVIPSLNLIGKTGWFLLLSVATVACGLFAAVLLVTQYATTAEYWMLGVLCGQLLIATVGVLVLYHFLTSQITQARPPKVGYEHIWSLYRYAWPIALATGFGWGQTQGYRYVLEHELGLSALGLFFAGYGLSAGLIAAFEAVITAYFQPKFYRRINTKEPVRQEVAWHGYAAAIIPSLLLTTLFIAAVAPQLASLFLGSSFQSAAVYVVWGAFAEGARVLASTYSLLAHARMRTSWLIIPSAVGAFLALGVTVVLLPVYGSSGAGVGLLVAGSGFVVTMHFLVRKQVRIELPVRWIAVAFGVGLLLWGILYLVQRWFAWETGLLTSIGIVSVLGCVVLFMQWIMLRGLVQDEVVYEDPFRSHTILSVDAHRVDSL